MSNIVKSENHKGPYSVIPSKGTVAHAIWKCLTRERGCTIREAIAAAKRAGSESAQLEAYFYLIVNQLKRSGWQLTQVIKDGNRWYKIEPLFPTKEAQRGRPKGTVTVKSEKPKAKPAKAKATKKPSPSQKGKGKVATTKAKTTKAPKAKTKSSKTKELEAA